ncbi:uncharacterized protein BROUX77_001358 [Berkeleyomyces rouxiae]|uniref:uncharacterized protein n=1 Tax=Berkeleyomyces rouxiae TaxID=2035830 RepID=UPI003B78581A
MAASPTLAAPPVLLPLPLPASATCCTNCGAKLEHHIDISAASEAQVALIEAQRRIAELEKRILGLQNQIDRSSVSSAGLPDSPPHSPYFHHQQKLSTSTSSSTASTLNYTHHNQASTDYLLTPPPSASAPRYVGEPPATPTPSRPTTSSSSSSSWSFSASRFTSLLSRKSTPNMRIASSSSSASSAQPLPSPPPTAKGVDDLMAALNKEQNLRAKAEGRLNATSKEVEELSVALFEQANEMVASERKARAKLEQRVAVLERRDAEKKARLQSLEGAMDQIQRVQMLLESSEPAPLPAVAAV